MKTLISIIAMPFRFIANSALSNFIVNLFKKAPWLIWLLSLFIALSIIFIEYGM